MFKSGRAGPNSQYGWLPALSLVSAVGLLSLSAVDWLAASGGQGLAPLFWLGLGIVALPIVVRLLAARSGRTERLGLVLVFGLDLYLVKVMQSPFAFTYGDEFLHLFNANRLVDTAHLFSPNSLLPASALYPGLESATVAVVRLTGLDVFSSGLVLVGLARVVMMLALFLLYEELTRSDRAASLACVLYAANSNFLFWSAQFSYESLALPLAVLALYLVARRESGRCPAERLGLTLAALVIIAAVVVTHHLSSYFLAAALSLWAVIVNLQRRAAAGQWLKRLAGTWPAQWLQRLVARLAGRPAWPAPRLGAATGGPGGLALFSLVAVLFWLTYVANVTLTYLSPVFGHALVSLLKLIGGEQTGRTLFQSTTGTVATPGVERVVGLAGVLLCLLGLPFGLRQVWHRSLHHPLVLLLAAAAVAYFGVLGLRFVPSAWEIANRSSEFLFIGLALVLGMARLPVWPLARRWLRPVLAGLIAVILAGGIIAGWPPLLRLTQVYRITTDGQPLEPVGLAVARWTMSWLGPGHNFIADEANGRLLLAYADQNVLTGTYRNAQDVLKQPGLSDDNRFILRDTHTEYVLVDRRLISDDNMAGYFFDRSGLLAAPAGQLYPPEAYGKFDQVAGVSRLVDGGNVVVYDVRAIAGGSAQP